MFSEQLWFSFQMKYDPPSHQIYTTIKIRNFEQFFILLG